MKDFFKMLFASTLGVFLASILLFLFSMLVLVGMAASFSATPTYSLTKETVLRIDLNGMLSDRNNENPFDFLFSGSTITQNTTEGVVNAIAKAKDNDLIKGIYIKGGVLSAGYASVEPIRKALIDFKESGKFIVCYAEQFTQNSYYASSVADKIYMNPQGMIEFLGLGSVRQYNKEVFQKWGVDIQVFKVGTYKSAVEPFTETKMSDANREQVTSYLHSIWGHLLSGISESRNISVEELNRIADQAILFADQNTYVENGLVDELGYASDVEKYIKSLLELEADDKLALASVAEVNTLPETKKVKGNDQIAILYAEGEIISDMQASIYNTGGITAKEYVREFRKLQDDDNVKAVVFRVNSPGGSAYASEQIWKALSELKEKKPVIVSMGSYAASGGYYISCNATKIVAEPTTLTGSIGIFGLFPSGEQLAKKMGAHYDGVGTNQHSLFGGGTLSIPFLGVGLLPARRLNDSEVQLMQAYIERGYDSFIGRCADGRGMTKEQIDPIAQGRVWTGEQALGHGLVDELGGIDRAIQLAAEAAEITQYNKVEYPEKKDLFMQLWSEALQGSKVQLLRMIVGKDDYNNQQEIKRLQSFDVRQAIMEDYIY